MKLSRAISTTRHESLTHSVPTLLALLVLTLVVPLRAQQQQEQPDSVKRERAKAYVLDPLNVTATRTEKRVFETPAPVAVLRAEAIREKAPNTVSDLFRDLPGLDVTGVGTNQVRPVIRGQRGQRVLLVQDGLRLNNSRRQQDFGELPGLVDVNTVERVEVVRGPASVLYGSDAIGGAINVITRTPTDPGIHGTAGYRYSTADNQNRLAASVAGQFGRLGLLANGALRRTDSYDAPGGSFGDITLAGNTLVQDTGVEDESAELYASYDIAVRHQLSLRVSHYSADNAGFGFVDPQAYAPELPIVRILYPYQRFNKVSTRYESSGLRAAVADRLQVVGYAQDNDRRLDNNVIVVPFPGASIDVHSENFTEVKTFGGRLEAAKLIGGRVMLTYGADLVEDRTENTDYSTETYDGFGPPGSPPSVVADSSPNLPFARYRSLGVFAQGELNIAPRSSVILGLRYQNTNARTKATPGLPDSLAGATDDDNAVVASANAIIGVTDQVSLVGSVGQGFRSPNLIELFFSGPIPEVPGAFLTRNPALKPERSLNIDLGLRYRTGALALEGFFFVNTVKDGIRIDSIGTLTNGLAEYQNVNVEELRYTGVELGLNAVLPLGFSVGGSYTHLDSKDVLNENSPVGDTYADKFSGTVRYTHPSDRFFLEYDVRVNGKRREADLGTFSVLTELPAFNTHSLRGSVVVWRPGTSTHRIGLGITNLSNALYAEFSNAGFFRPEPKRGVIMTYDVSF